MKSHTNRLIICCFCCLPWIAHAEDFKPGSAFPANRTSKMNLPLSTFINQRSHVTDWSLVVLIRGEKHYILSDKVNRQILSEPAAQGDTVALDDAATAFLGWRRLNPEMESSVFWKANPQLQKQTIQYSSSATGGDSSTVNDAVSNPPESHPARSSIIPPPTPQSSPPKKAPTTSTTSTPSEVPTSSTPWSIIIVLIVAATGLLWLLVKNRK
jgi:hypothetical protein